MEVRKATQADYKSLAMSVRNKHIDYITLAHLREDLAAGNLWVGVSANKIICICSIIWNEKRDFYCLKRLTILNRKNAGKGYAKQFLRAVLANYNGTISVTPWIDNVKMRKLLESLGFKFSYIFNDIWCCFLLTA